MTTQVDEQNGVVRVGSHAFPFELDCRSGTATLALGSLQCVLRSPSWREKRVLARFSHLGSAFVEAQFLRQCLASDVPPPPPGPEREALSPWRCG